MNTTERIQYPNSEPPKIGEVREVADGVFWLRMPLPMAGLDHINLYILRDGDDFVIVDTGLGWREAKEIWERVFTRHFKGKAVSRIICTHLHPDHTGLAGWLCARFNAPLLMSRAEYLLCRTLAADTGKPAPPEGILFYQRAGLTTDEIEHYKKRFGGFGKAISPLPNAYQRLQDNDILMVGDSPWQIIIGSGHSPEHACLYNKEKNLFISGDQLLPSISSNVGVWPTEPEANPLEDWINSCQKLLTALPEDVTVLPAHGLPFIGAHIRLNRLIRHHENALERLYKLCQSPKLAVETYPVLFRRKIDDGNRLMAVGESIAHLNCLRAQGRVERRLNAEGRFLYQSIKTS